MWDFKAIFLLMALSVVSFNVLSKEQTATNAIGFVETIDSKILSRTLKIQIYLPPAYDSENSKQYPVMYIMDGDWYFLHGVGYQKSLQSIDHSPDFIVVGINTDTDLAKRSAWYRAEDWDVIAPKLINFLDQEVIAYVDKKFRTSDERIYFGWEKAGYLGMHIFTENTSLFTAYILANTSAYDERALEKSITAGAMKNRFLYVGVGSEEKWQHDDIKMLTNFFELKRPKGLTWRLDILQGEDHYSAPDTVIHNGLRKYFKDYRPLRFGSLKSFSEFGGIAALYEYYKVRGERYGVVSEIHPDTKHYLFLQAIKENDIRLFKRFYDEFEGHFKTYRWYGYESGGVNLGIDMFVRYGKFSLAHKQPDLALAIYQEGLLRHPDSPIIYNGFADAYRMKADYEMAGAYYEKAMKIAKEAGRHEVFEYAAKLTELRQFE